MHPSKRIKRVAAGFGVGALAATVGLVLPTQSQAVSLTDQAVYVSNTSGDTVSVIDPLTNTILTTMAVGDEPRNLAISPDRTKVYVPNRGDDTVSVINTTTNTVTATFNVGDEPYAVAFNASGTKAYVANKAASTVSVVNAVTNSVSGTITDACIDSPEGIATNPVTDRAYVVSRQSDATCVVNTTTDAVIATVPVGNDPRYAVVTPDGSAVFVSNNGSADVTRIATSNNATTTIATTGAPRNMAINAGGSKVYVALQSSDIAAINVSNNSVTSIPFTAMNSSYAVALVAGTDLGYVTDVDDDTVQVFSTVTETQTTGAGLPITGFSEPRGIAAFGIVPTPPAPARQYPLKACVTVPKESKVPANGTVRLMKANCKTNAGQKVRVKQNCATANRGDVSFCKLIRKNGATFLKTKNYGQKLRIKITWSAPKTADYAAYKKVRNYRV